MFLFLIFNLIASAETMWVDANGDALYKSLEHCQKYSRGVPCFKTDDKFDVEYYELSNGEFVKNDALASTVKAARKAKEDADRAEKLEIKSFIQKLNDGTVTNAEIRKILKFLLKGLD